MTSTRVLMTAGTSVAAACLLWPTAAAADQTYRTQKYPLVVEAGADAPLAKGSVINTHANGPVVYGNERYSLVGAEPSTTYYVALTIYADAACTVEALFFPTATLRTNRVGNGHATARFYGQDVAPLVPAPTTVAGAWTFSHSPDGSDVVFTTGCQAITLDVPPPPPPGHSRR